MSPQSQSPTIFLSVAEPSGDLHAAGLIEALRERLPDARFLGAAGPRMAATGCEVVEDLTHKASMVGGPLLRLPFWFAKVRRLAGEIHRLKPDVVIPVDSPALNWHIASAARTAGSKVFYYIAPQVWGWAPWRVKKLARLTDAVGCILPFEEEYLRQRGVNATFVGHPLSDRIPPAPEVLPDLSQAWAQGAWNVVLLPGSRTSEIRRNAPALRQTERAIRRRWPGARCVYAAASEAQATLLRETIGPDRIDVEVARTYEVMARSHFAVAVSGTVTLEAAYFGLPMVVLYHTAAVERLVFRAARGRLIRTPHLALVNILAGRRLVPEMVPMGSAAALVRTVLEVMEDLGWLHETRRELLQLVRPLRPSGQGTAAGNAAALVVDLLDGASRR